MIVVFREYPQGEEIGVNPARVEVVRRNPRTHGATLQFASGEVVQVVETFIEACDLLITSHPPRFPEPYDSPDNVLT